MTFSVNLDELNCSASLKFFLSIISKQQKKLSWLSSVTCLWFPSKLHGHCDGNSLMHQSDCRWYSLEYDAFYLDSAATTYTLHMPSSGIGDTNDTLSGSNGKIFYDNNSTSFCVSTYSPGWYYMPYSCNSFRAFGLRSSGGFAWASDVLQVARMMIKA